MPALMIGWTTTETRQEAERLASGAVERRLAACVQIEGPITSIFTWEDKMEKNSEYRLVFKFTESKAEKLQLWLLENHPYTTPHWVAVKADKAAPDYQEWVHRVCR